MGLGYCFFNSYVYVSSTPPPVYTYLPFTGAVLGTGGSQDIGWSITVDPQQFVYVCGYYNTSANIYNSSGTVIGTLPSVTSDAAFACKFSNAGVLQYSLVVDSAGSDQGTSVRTDTGSNVYVSGFYNGTPNIVFRSNLNASTTLGTLPVSASNAIFACKFSSTGTLLYSLVVDGTGSDAGYGSFLDSLGNYYIGGSYNGTPNIVFRSSSNVSTTLGTLPASSGDAAFTTKFSGDGTLAYSFVVDATTNNDRTWAVACDAFSNVYFGGQYNGTPNIVFRSNSNVSTTLGTLPATAGTDVAFATKCDSAGALQYSFVIDGTGSDISYSLACDSFSNVYIGLQYQGTPNIILRSNANVSTTVGTLSTSSGSYDGAVCKFSQNGTLQYSFIISGSANDGVLNGLACDASSNVIISGYCESTASLFRRSNANVSVLMDTFPAVTGSADAAFVSKFDSNGNYFFSIVSDSTANDNNRAVATDQYGNLYFGCQNQNGPLRDASTRQYLNYSIVNPVPTQTALPARLGVYYTKTSPTGSTGIPQLGYYPNFARIINASTSSQVNGLACDSGSNIYAAYTYTGTTPPIINQNSTTLGSLPTGLGAAAAMTKFDTVGTVLFSRIVDSSSTESGTCVAVDSSSSNVYLGTVINGAVTVKDQAGTSLGTVPGTASSGALLSKFSSTNGNYQYSLVIESGGADQCLAATCDPTGNVYMSGYYNTAANINYVTTAGTVTIQGTLPATSAFGGMTSKFTSNGTLLYTLLINTTSGLTQQVLGTTCDTTGNVYISGLTISTANIGYVSNSNVLTTLGTIPTPTNYGAYTVKFSQTGSLLYSLYVDSSTSDWAYAPVCDFTGNVYVGGFYASAAGGTASIIYRSNANVSTTVGTLPTAAGQAAFISKFSSTGTLLYSYVLDASAASNLEAVYSTACDLYGNVYFTGEYNGTPTLTYVSNANVSTTITTLPASSGATAYMVSISPTGTFNYARIVDATTNADRSYAVACDQTGNVFFGGQYNGTTSIKDHLGTTIGTLPTLTNKGFIIEFAGSATPSAQNLVPTLSNVYYTTLPYIRTGNESRLVSTATDVSGNVFFISQRSATAPVLTSKNAVTMKTMPPTVVYATSLVKFTNKGRYEWDVYSTNFGNAGTSNNVMCSLSVENSNVYAGSQQVAANVVTFYNTSNVAVSAIPASGSADTADSYIAKFDTNGTFQWKSYVQGDNNYFPSVAAAHNDDAVYLAGTKNGTAQMTVFNTSNVSVATIPATSTSGSFLVKYDRSGTYQWRAYMDNSTLVNRGVITDAKSNVYITGYFSGTTSANVYASTGSTRAAVISKTGTSETVYLVKYLTDGSFSWYAYMVGTGSSTTQQFGHGCDPKSNVYITGITTNTMTIYDKNNTLQATVSNSNGFIVKFAEDGTYHWYASVYSPTAVAFDKVGTDIDFDPGSNVYASFSFLTPSAGSTSNVTVRDGTGTLTQVSVGVINTSFNMVVKFSEAGVFQWACPQTTVVQSRTNSALSVFGSNVYVTGSKLTTATTVYDRNLTAAVTIPATSSNAAYMAHYLSDGTYAFSDFQLLNF